jgi:hypothetical protein
MTIALLALIGVDLWLILVLAVATIHRRRTVTGRRGAFKGKLRVAEGELEGFSPKWTSGYGQWARDVLVWNPTPFMVRTATIPVDGTDTGGIHAASVKGLGRQPVVIPLLAEHRVRLELAAADEDRELVLGPFAQTSAVGSLVPARLAVGADIYPNDN